MVDTVIFPTRTAAYAAVNILNGLLENQGYLKANQVVTLYGLPEHEVDDHLGWYSLLELKVAETNQGWELWFPVKVDLHKISTSSVASVLPLPPIEIPPETRWDRFLEWGAHGRLFDAAVYLLIIATLLWLLLQILRAIFFLK